MTEKGATFPPCRTLCVGAIVLQEEKILLVRQTYGYLKGKWSIPWGYVEETDSPEDTAIKETKEEAGIDAQVQGLLGIQNHQSDEGDLRLYLLFLCKHLQGDPTPDHRETDQAAYLSLQELEAIAEKVDPFCLWLAKKVLQEDYMLIRPYSENPYKPHIAFL